MMCIKIDIFKSIKNKITEKTWDALEYDKDYMKIKFESNNISPTDKDVNIHLSAIQLFLLKMVNTILNYF